MKTLPQGQENIQPATVTFLIKRYDTGKLTPHVHALNIGDRMEFRGPIQKFKSHSKSSHQGSLDTFSPDTLVNEFEEVVLIGGGSGMCVLDPILKSSSEEPDRP